MNTLLAVSPYFGPLARPVVIFLVLLGLALGLKRTPLAGGATIATWLAIAVPLLAWFLLANWIAQTDFYRSFPAARRIATLVPPVIWLVLLMRSTRVAAALDAMPRSWLIGVQLYRVLGSVSLVLWAVGRLPGTFALPAGIGDAVTGALALPVAIYVGHRASHWRLAGIVWNLFGLADFAVALSIAILVLSTGYPGAFIMIPTFMVPLGIVLHGLSLWQLARAREAVSSGPTAYRATSGAAAE